MKSEEIKNRFDQLVSLRKTLDETLQYIERFCRPFNGEFFQPQLTELEVIWRRRHIYDSTAPNAVNLLAAQMHGNLTSPAIRWFYLTFRDKRLQQNQQARAWLEQVAEVMWLALQESDFNLEASSAYLDLVSFGSAFITEEEESEENWQGIDFSTVPVREAYYEPDAKGGVKRFYRLLQYTKLQLIDKFGEENMPETIVNRNENDVDQKHDVVFCVYYRDDKQDADTSRSLAPKARPVGYQYILHNSGERLGEEGGYYEMPAFMARWLRTSGSRMGYSPAFVALSDILQLNEVVKQTSESRAKAIDPATLTTENGLISDLDLQAGGLTIVQSLDEVAPFESRARFDQADAEIERLQRSIRQTFFIDKLELKDSPAMTATEVRVRYERMQRLLGPTLGRLQSEFLDPLLKRTFMILLRAGQLPDMPQVLMDQGVNLDIEYTGPLPRAQKTETAESIEYWLATLTGLAQVFPDLLDTPDPDAVGRKLAELRGVPADVMHSVEDVAEKRAEREAQMQQAAALEQAQAGGAAVRDMGAGAKSLSEAGVDTTNLQAV